ncbi:MAG: hypothetical protein ACI845_000356 [Gammaproteobacteria bacterium]
MFKPIGLIVVLCLTAKPGLVISADKFIDPMKPPAYALQKFRQEKNKSKPKTIVKAATRVVVEPLRLTSILISKNRRIVIIDDQMLVVGDVIKNAKVTRIDRESARLVRRGKVINLTLNNDSTAIIKKAVESKL